MQTVKWIAAVILLVLLNNTANAQQLRLGNNPFGFEKSAVLELQSTNQGLLFPRIADTALINVLNPPDGMVIYHTSQKALLLRANGYWNRLTFNSSLRLSNLLDVSIASPSSGQILRYNGTAWVNFTPNYLTSVDTSNISNFYTKVRSLFSAGTGITLVNGQISSSINTANFWAMNGNTVTSMKSLGSIDNFSLPFITNNVERMRITNTGTVGIGTSTFDGTNPEKLLVDAGATSSFNVISGKGTINNYLQLNIQNKSNGAAASSDIVATADNGTESANFVDLGINSSGYNSTGILAGANNGYLYSTGNDFAIGNATANKDLIFFSGGTNTNNERMRIDGNGFIGIGNTAPNNYLEVSGTNTTTGVSGLRLTNLGTATVATANTKLLSVNSNGDVIVTNNPASANWLFTGNAGINPATNFLGTTDDKQMILKSNNQSYLEFGRRQTLGLTQGYTDYDDNDEKVTHIRSALQFEAAGAQFYKPKMYTDVDGNFRVKGSSAGTDYFEFGSTGSNNSGGFEFVIGDDGDEPILFKSYHYINGYSEIMRLQSGRMAVGSNAFDATNPEKLLIDAGVTNSYNLMTGKGSIDNYLQINVQNRSAGGSASSDVVATSNNGSESVNYIDMGINGGGYTNNSLPMLAGANTAYLYSTGNDFVLGNGTASKNMRFFTGGFATTNERMRIDGNGNVAIGATAFDASNPEQLLVDAGTTTSFNVISGKGTINNYLQLNIQNKSNGNSASSDVVATADNGTESVNFVDLGINSSTYSTGGMLGGANNSYLYSTGNDFVIGNATAAKPIRFFTGGTAVGNERLRIEGSGNVGIGTTAPTAILDVAGTFKLGTAGTVLNSIIKGSISVTDNTNFGQGATRTVSATVTGATTQGAVIVNPRTALTNGIAIAWARVSAANTVTIGFTCTNGLTANLGSVTFDVTIIQ